MSDPVEQYVIIKSYQRSFQVSLVCGDLRTVPTNTEAFLCG